MLLNNHPRRPLVSILSPNVCRSIALVSTYTHGTALAFYKHSNKINVAMLAPGGAWPVKFDPWFNLAAVAREKCVVSNCNLLTFFHSNADKKIPTRPTLATFSRVEIFACDDLTWLMRMFDVVLK